MKFGLFSIPFALDYADGRKPLREVIDWDLQIARWGDEYGCDEVFFAEHYTLGRECSPAPDLMIAAAAVQTSRITLGAAAHLVPYHNPIALAHRMMWLDHLTGGRYIAGVAPGAYPSDAQLFGTGNDNPAMMVEGLDIIEAIWTKPGPFTIKGKYWSVDMPSYDDEIHGPHLRPVTMPHPPIAMTGMQATSPTLKVAARRGYLPVSQQVSNEALAQHWQTYETAALEAGYTPSRADWRICRDWLVADTDAQARDLVVNGAMGRTWSQHLLPTFKDLGLVPLMVGNGIAPEDLTVEWMADNFWIVGSPDTVIEKVRALDAEVGGFGSLVTFTHDYSRSPEAYRRSIELMGTVVAPALNQED